MGLRKEGSLREQRTPVSRETFLETAIYIILSHHVFRVVLFTKYLSSNKIYKWYKLTYLMFDRLVLSNDLVNVVTVESGHEYSDHAGARPPFTVLARPGA